MERQTDASPATVFHALDGLHGIGAHHLLREEAWNAAVDAGLKRTEVW